jgi:glycosyltransferase involved in cell wall biosynthesis
MENISKFKQYTIGIDATNLRAGGGVTHLMELLRAAQPIGNDFNHIVVWGSKSTLKALEAQPWLSKRNPPALDKGLLQRTLWQRYHLSQAARDEGCDVLFVPGGSYAGNFHPVVTMSQNLLPFEWRELRRYGLVLLTLKFTVLRYTQSHSFQRADGVIFLTEWAKQAVLKVTGELSGKTATIPHGLNPRFRFKPKEQRPIDEYTESNPFRLLYVSNIDQYKHQWHVVEAVHALRAAGLSVLLELVGPAYPPALARLQAVIARLDPEGRWVHYRGVVPYESLHSIYEDADIGIFASSCENMPNILLETMAAGLPVACSNRGPMPEVLGDTGLYFNPENPAEITQSIRKFILSPELRSQKAKASFERAKRFSWGCCADQTFSFLSAVVKWRSK